LKSIKEPSTLTYTAQERTFAKGNIIKFLIDNYPIIAVILGYLLVALSIGPYFNGDTTWETDAVKGVMKYGLPYANGFYLMDQPPLGFYIQAGFAKAFGMSLSNGTFLVTMFGLGAVILVYLIGKEVYNKTTGFFSALLFAFNPWMLILSRSFLIDVQCLFFSLLSLFVGVIAIKKGSFKLIIASAFIFAAAFNTKLYAAFILIPLLGYFLYCGPKKPKQITLWIASFSIPGLFFSYLWYQTITGLGLFSIFGHTDFNVNNPSGLAPTYFFATNFLISYGLGWFFIDAVILSLLVYFIQRHLSRNFLVFDAISVAVIVCALSVNTVLGATLNLKAPFLDAVKYDFQTLPFFSFLAASLISKSLVMLNSVKAKVKINKIFFYVIAMAGIILVIASIFYNMRFTNLFSNANFLIFRVEPGVDVGYSLFNSSPSSGNMVQLSVQFVGFVIALSGLLWISRHKINSSLSFFIKDKKRKRGLIAL
jgi:4-amino-4-deoxy-L-arabinose transferase-like glycosyltransferase